MATYPPPPVTFVRGAGQPPLGRRRSPVSRLPLRTGRHVARPRPPRRRRRRVRSRPGPCCTSPTSSGPSRSARSAATLDRLVTPAPGRVFFCNSGAEANECAIKLARRWGGRGTYVVVSAYGSFHGRTLATLHATGQPAKHEAVPAAARGLPPRGLAAISTPWPRPSTRRVAAVLLEPVQGEGGVQPGRGRLLPGGPPALRRTRVSC